MKNLLYFHTQLIRLICPMIFIIVFGGIAVSATSAVTNNDSGADSFRQAILNANANADAETVYSPNGFDGVFLRSGKLLITDDFDENGSRSFFAPLNFITGSHLFDNISADFKNRKTEPVPGKLEFLLSGSIAGESSGTATLTVLRFDGADGAVSVDYTLGSGIATGGEACAASIDYINTGGRINFANDQTSQIITVPICNDSRDEFNESFRVTLVNPTGGATIGTVSEHVVSITDDDPTPTISINDVTQIEGSSGTSMFLFTLSLSEASGRQISISFETSDGTALANNDYTPLTGFTFIEEGETSKQIPVRVTADARVEQDETFFINLSNPSLITIGDGQGIGTIINDDIGGNVQLNSPVYNVAENGGAATVTITRANGNASDIIVQYSTNNGTAIAGQDYTSVSGSVTFGANETTKTFTVPIINDVLNEEPMESVNLSLNSVAGGATLGTPSTAVLNISDDDPLPKIRIGNSDIKEGNQGSTTALVAVSLLAASGRTVSVDFTTLNGTATSPTDYTTVSGTLSFAPGEISKTIPILIAGDRDIEPNEFFQISLSNPLNSTLDTASGTITITNDDFQRSSYFDFDGDGRSDISVFRPSTGAWYLLNSNIGFTASVFGQSGDKLVPADYDGDGKTDLAVFRNGSWYIQRSTQGFYSLPFGNSSQIPAPADFTGDGRADIAVFVPASGAWYMYDTTTGQTTSFQFGQNGDLPVAADYDGDGRADYAVFRTNTWYIKRSTAGFFGLQFGTTGELAVPAD